MSIGLDDNWDGSCVSCLLRLNHIARFGELALATLWVLPRSGPCFVNGASFAW